MNLFHKIWKEFVYGGHLIALGAASITVTSAIVLKIAFNWQFLIAIYLLTFSGLLYNRYKEEEIDAITNTERTNYLKKYFPVVPLIVLFSCFLSFLILMAFREFKVMSFLFFLFPLFILYTLCIKNMTREIPVLKNISFSLLASCLVLLLAFRSSLSFLDGPLLLMTSFVFLRMLNNTIFLDIKDLKSDKRQKLLTIPIMFGTNNTLILLKCLTVASGFLIVGGVFLKHLPPFSLMLLFVIPYSFYYFKESKKDKKFYLTNYVLADLEFFSWAILVLIGRLLI